MLIRDAEIWGGGRRADLRIADRRVAAIGTLAPRPGEAVVDARGGALLPGLHDHHIHLAALAARRTSVACGPPAVTDAEGLARALAQPGNDWLRGVGYHESVAGMPDRVALDRMAPDRPVRIQHRGGRMWFLNTAALDRLLAAAPPPAGLDRATGRLFDEDAWLRTALGSAPPGLAAASADLAAHGVTGLTDMSPANDPDAARYLAQEQGAGALVQSCHLAGTLALAGIATTDRLAIGPAKLHLHEADLPEYDAAIAFVRAAHAQARAVAIHCTTETELVFALAALAEGGVAAGDRIEHASVTPDALLAEIAAMKLAVVSQPHFIAERGEQYLAAVAPEDVPLLYRLRAFRAAGVTLAGGSDAPFGTADPWAAVAAAVSRRTRAGTPIGADEALTPEEAIGLFLADPADLSCARALVPHAPADLCLLDRPWSAARARLVSGDVRLVVADGRIVHQRVDKAPLVRGGSADPAA